MSRGTWERLNNASTAAWRGKNSDDTFWKAEVALCYEAEEWRTDKEILLIKAMPRKRKDARHSFYTFQECPHDWQMARLSWLNRQLHRLVFAVKDDGKRPCVFKALKGGFKPFKYKVSRIKQTAPRTAGKRLLWAYSDIPRLMYCYSSSQAVKADSCFEMILMAKWGFIYHILPRFYHAEEIPDVQNGRKRRLLAMGWWIQQI